MLEWIGAGGKATEKRIPAAVFAWPVELLESFLEGLVDGDGTVEATRTSVWTTSEGLVSDLLVLFARLGRRAGTSWRDRGHAPICQVYAPTNEHKLLTGVPLPDELLVALRERGGLDQQSASRAAGYKHASDLNNIERRAGRDAVRFATLRRLRDAYASGAPGTEELARLDRLVDGDLLWDEVVEVRDTGVTETIFDIEVRPGGRRIENFLAGSGGVFVSNTAGFVDAGWDGHLTLELSNVANLPDRALPGHEDRADLVPAHDDRGRSSLREPEHGFQVPGAAWAHAFALLPELPRRGVAGRVPEPARCEWAGTEPLMVAYHDDEWGVPTHDDALLFELLTLEGAQAGLSWRTILNKRAGYRAAFAGFDPARVAEFTDGDVERLLADAGIVRHRGKIESTINNAQRVRDVQRRARHLRRVRVVVRRRHADHRRVGAAR